MTETYDSDGIRIAANFSQPASHVTWQCSDDDPDTGCWHTTPLSVSDVGIDRDAAVEAVIAWLERGNG